MSNILQQNLDEILLDKNTNLLPENLKDGITCLGVTGTLQSGSDNIKLFKTREEMYANTNVKKGDLAVVYKNEVQNAKIDSIFSSAMFPEKVILDTVYSGSIGIEYGAIDDSRFSCYGRLNNSGFTMNCTTDNESISIAYTSTDGINYTRTRLQAQNVDGDDLYFGVKIHYIGSTWDDIIGKFINPINTDFEGLFMYKLNQENKNYISILGSSGVSYDFDNQHTISNFKYTKVVDTYINKDQLITLLSKMRSEMTDFDDQIYIGYNNNTNKFYAVANNSSIDIILDLNRNVLGLGYSSSYVAEYLKLYELDFVNNTYSEIASVTKDTASKVYTYNSYASNKYSTYLYVPVNITSLLLYVVLDSDNNISSIRNTGYSCILGTTSSSQASSGIGATLSANVGSISLYKLEDKYVPAPTQLDATPEYVYTKDFYGINGAEAGSLQNTTNLSKDDLSFKASIWNSLGSLSTSETNLAAAFRYFKGTTLPKLTITNAIYINDMFAGCENLTSIDLSGFDTSNVTNMNNMFSNCHNLTNLDLTSFNTSNTTNIGLMFSNCFNLTNVNLTSFDTSKVTSMSSMFYSCASLVTLNLPFNTSSVTDMSSMFNDCQNLKTLNLTSFNTSNVTDMRSMFYHCSNLEQLDLSSFDFTKVTAYTYMLEAIPVNCLIYVKDETAKTWITSKFTSLTNVQVKITS